MLRNAHVRYTRAHYSVVCVCVCVGVGVGLLAAVAVAGAQRRALLVRWHLGLVVVFVTCHAGGGKGVLAFCVARRGRHGARRACARFASYKGQGRGDGARSRRSRSVIALRIAPVAGASGTAASLTASSSCCCPSAIASQAQRSVDRVCAGGVADREGVLRAGGKRSPACDHARLVSHARFRSFPTRVRLAPDRSFVRIFFRIFLRFCIFFVLLHLICGDGQATRRLNRLKVLTNLVLTNSVER